MNKRERRIEFIKGLKELCYKYEVDLSFDEHEYTIVLIDRSDHIAIPMLNEEWLYKINFKEDKF